MTRWWPSELPLYAVAEISFLVPFWFSVLFYLSLFSLRVQTSFFPCVKVGVIGLLHVVLFRNNSMKKFRGRGQNKFGRKKCLNSARVSSLRTSLPDKGQPSYAQCVASEILAKNGTRDRPHYFWKKASSTRLAWIPTLLLSNYWQLSSFREAELSCVCQSPLVSPTETTAGSAKLSV